MVDEGESAGAETMTAWTFRHNRRASIKSACERLGILTAEGAAVRGIVCRKIEYRIAEEATCKKQP